jgi:hypothetical protein
VGILYIDAEDVRNTGGMNESFFPIEGQMTARRVITMEDTEGS